MIKKSYSKTGKVCRVTFRVGADEVEASEVAVLGDFNEWNPQANPLVHRKDGSFSATLSLDSDRQYRFRYLADHEQWLNDAEVETLVANRFGTRDCLLEV